MIINHFQVIFNTQVGEWFIFNCIRVIDKSVARIQINSVMKIKCENTRVSEWDPYCALSHNIHSVNSSTQKSFDDSTHRFIINHCEN